MPRRTSKNRLRRRSRGPVESAVQDVTIDRLGHLGDGIVELNGDDVYIPYTAPGDRVRIGRSGKRGKLLSMVEAGPHRAPPVCPHFGECGGCSVQHLEADLYRSWKVGRLETALKSQDVSYATMAELFDAGQRRRLAFSYKCTVYGDVSLGFLAPGSHRLVPIQTCPVACDGIVAHLGALKSLLGVLTQGVGGRGKAFVTLTEAGLDINIAGPERFDLDADRIDAVIRQVRCFPVVRLCVAQDVIIQLEPPSVSFADVSVVLPSGGFLQASTDAERYMSDLVVEHLKGARSVVDLFSGCGTFTFPLARHVRVHAVDGSGDAIAALNAARDTTTGVKRVTSEVRDLFRRPLGAKDLNMFDCAVFDPPRAGAAEQAKALANSDLTKIVGVSCNPATFARDARLLLDGGFVLDSVYPVDQFKWSHHIEVVGLFHRSG